MDPLPADRTAVTLLDPDGQFHSIVPSPVEADQLEALRLRYVGDDGRSSAGWTPADDAGYHAARWAVVRDRFEAEAAVRDAVRRADREADLMATRDATVRDDEGRARRVWLTEDEARQFAQISADCARPASEGFTPYDSDRYHAARWAVVRDRVLADDRAKVDLARARAEAGRRKSRAATDASARAYLEAWDGLRVARDRLAQAGRRLARCLAKDAGRHLPLMVGDRIIGRAPEKGAAMPVLDGCRVDDAAEAEAGGKG